MTSSNNDIKDGTKGFSPQLGGAGKAGKTHTSSDVVSANNNAQQNELRNGQPGQEENGRMRQPTTSVVAHISQEKPK